jgi:dUTP pyrophosphatase
MVTVLIKHLTATSRVPEYQTALAAGADCYADLPKGAVYLEPGQRALIGLGFCVAVQPGYEMQLRPRSGLAFKHGIGILNSPGTIDADYRGEVKALLVNHGSIGFMVNPGDRICQAVIAKVPVVEFLETSELPDTDRGDGGFGHTGA